MGNLRIGFIAGMTLSLCSCAEAKELTESRARALIEENVRYYPCVGFNVGDSSDAVYVNGAPVEIRTFLSNNAPFPVTVAVGRVDRTFSGNELDRHYRKLRRAGLATSKEAGSITTNGGTTELRTYELSKLGQSMLQVVSKSGSGKEAFSFCWGKGKVSELVDYRAPTKDEKYKKVTFRWTTVDDKGDLIRTLPDRPWVKIFFGPRPPLLAGERVATLKMSDNGWQLVR